MISHKREKQELHWVKLSVVCVLVVNRKRSNCRKLKQEEQQ